MLKNVSMLILALSHIACGGESGSVDTDGGGIPPNDGGSTGDGGDTADGGRLPEGAVPSLAFSDLISGADTELGDGLGSGVVVTLWGNYLGSSQGDSTIVFTDADAAVNPVHVYYWKNADGILPGGPADLFSSHKMQEIAFSIPVSATGVGTIHVEVDGEVSNSLPFTVRPGSIYHITSAGDDNTGDGSWANPWQSVAHADDTAGAGSTLYIHDVDTGNSTARRGIYWNRTASSSTLDAQFGYVAFPGFRPKVTAQRAVEGNNVQAMVVSKLDLYASNYTSVDSNGQPTGQVIDNSPSATYGIETTKNGRAVGNRIGDIPGGCASAAAGAIKGDARFSDKVGNHKSIGNEIYDYGCYGSSKLHHTTYLSVRSNGANRQVEPWEFHYNYLHGNQAKFGIHQFDQNTDCGNTTGPIKIHNNVIVDQAGAGISVGSQCDWSMDVEIFNNILINVGLAAAWDGIDPDTTDGAENGGIAIRDSGLLGTMIVRNNLIYRWNTDGATTGGRGCLNLNGSGDNVSIVWQDNVCYSDLPLPYVGTGNAAENKLDNVSGANNLWFQSGSGLVVPDFDSQAISMDPMLTITGSTVEVNSNSPLLDSAMEAALPRDIYGVGRGENPDMGPVERVE